MANLIKIFADRVELPFQQLQYSITPPVLKLQEGLEAYRALQSDLDLQSRPLEQRREVGRFLCRYGQLLYRTLLTPEAVSRLKEGRPLLLELSLEWAEYPWELLHDGRNWLGVENGVLRFLFQPYMTEDPRREGNGGPFRLLGVSARPVTRKESSEVYRQTRQTGERFISPLSHLLDGPESLEAACHYRALEHARPAELEQALAGLPNILFYSGFAGEGGWWLEGDDSGPARADWEWITTRVRQCAKMGLEVGVFNDSLGFTGGNTALIQARELLRAGLTAVVRMEGRLARLRQQDYLRTLVRHIKGGHGTAASHLAAVRRLQRRFPEGWDWSFLRLYSRGLPPETRPGEAYAAGGNSAIFNRDLTHTLGGSTPGMPPLPVQPAPRPVPQGPAGFRSMPAPPRLAPRRRMFNRRAEMLELTEIINAGPRQGRDGEGAQLTFLVGSPGSGKTMLALELAHRQHRRFSEVAYIQSRDFLPEADEVAPLEGLIPPAPPAGWPLVRALGRNLGVDPGGALGGVSWVSRLGGGSAGDEDVSQAEGRGPFSRLLILDRLEQDEGFEAFCQALATLPAATRVLILCRNAPPLLPGRIINLQSVEPRSLKLMFGEAFVETLEHYPDGGGLLLHCCSDLFAARLLRRMQHWPEPGQVSEVLSRPSPQRHTGFIELLLERLLNTLGRDEARVLSCLSFFPDMAHHDVLGSLAGLEPMALQAALTGLQWAGLVDSFDGERYLQLPQRLQRLLVGRLLDERLLTELQPRLLRAYQAYLGSVSRELQTWRAGAGGGEGQPEAEFSWRNEAAPAETPSRRRFWQRLAVERVNLAEVATLLTENGDWLQLERFISEAAPLAGIKGMEDLSALLNQCLSAAGAARGDGVLLAQGITRLAGPHIENGDLEQARILLERALELLGPTDGWSVMGETYRLLGRCHMGLGNVEAARNLMLSAIELARQLEDPDMLVECCENLEMFSEQDGGGPDGLEHMLNQHMEYLERGGRGIQAARMQCLQARLMVRSGQQEQARGELRQALDVFRAMGDARGAARALMELAELEAGQGNAQEALECWRDARGEPQAVIQPRQHLGLVKMITRRAEAGEDQKMQLEAWLELKIVLEKAGSRQELLEVLDNIGGLYFQLGEQEKSTRCYQERLQIQTTLSR